MSTYVALQHIVFFMLLHEKVSSIRGFSNLAKLALLGFFVLLEYKKELELVSRGISLNSVNH